MAPRPPGKKVLDFDDIPLSDGGEQPLDSYGGFDWNQVGVYNPNGVIPGYQPSSGDNLAFIGEYNGNNIPGYGGAPGDPMTITRSDGDDFNFFSAHFGAAFRDDLELTVTAYDDGEIVGTKTFTVDTDGPTRIKFQGGGERFKSIYKLEIDVSDDATPDADDYFYLDDFTYNPANDIFIA